MSHGTGLNHTGVLSRQRANGTSGRIQRLRSGVSCRSALRKEVVLMLACGFSVLPLSLVRSPSEAQKLTEQVLVNLLNESSVPGGLVLLSEERALTGPEQVRFLQG